jgi:hypothetical protein
LSTKQLGRYLAVVVHDTSMKVDCTSRAGSNPDVLWRHFEEYVYAVSAMNIGDLMARPEAPATAVHTNMLWRVRENSVERTAVWLEPDGGRL